MLNIKYEKKSNTYGVHNCDNIYLGYIGKILEGDLWNWCFYPEADTEFNKGAMKEILKCLEDPAQYMETNKNE